MIRVEEHTKNIYIYIYQRKHKEIKTTTITND